MCSHLKEIYDKKSPIFIAEIVMFIGTFIIFTQYSCSCFPVLTKLYLAILIITGAQLFSKSIILAAIHAINKQLANTIQTIMVVLFLLAHIFLWIYSIILYNNPEFISCRDEEPHYFFLKTYVFVYGILLVGSLALLLLLLIPVAVLTLFSNKPKKEQVQLQ